MTRWLDDTQRLRVTRKEILARFEIEKRNVRRG